MFLVSENISLKSNAHEKYNEVCDLLEKDEAWIESFIAGFDEGFLTFGLLPENEAYQMGKRLRNDLKPVDFDDFIRSQKKQN